jgi:glucose/arabinose dehydrogenase
MPIIEGAPQQAPAKPSAPPEQPKLPPAQSPSPPAPGAVSNPAKHFAAPVAKSDLAADLVDVVKIPPSSNQAPLAAINFLTHAGDGSGRLFVNDMRGKIYIIRDRRLLETPFLDVAAARNPYFRSDGQELGLLTFAFHPDFATTGTRGFGRFYTIHTENLGGIADSGGARVLWDPTLHPDHFTVVTEWLVDPNNPDRIDPASRREVLRFGPWRKDHAGGQLAFDPNLKPSDPDYGLLYISVGDGGDSVLDGSGLVDIHRQAQNTAVPFGKILRIDPLENGKAHYGVPATNPFVNQPGFLPEIWALGLRNPERFSWDRGGQHKMLIADIGQANIEEIDLGQAGANYGWSTYEGRFIVDHENEKNLSPPPDPLPPGFVFPAAEYDHTDGVAVTGGFVYRGKALPQLMGKYIFGDIVSGDIFYADADALESGKDAKIYKLRIFYRGKETPMRTPQQDTGSAGKGIVGDNGRVDLRFGMDQDGEIYVLTKADGMIRRLASHAP